MKNCFWLIIALLWAASTAFAGNKVLVIESYHQAYAWDTSFEKGINKTLGSQYSLEYFYMDTKRLPKMEHQGMADKAWNKYIESNPDLVILADDAALKMLGPKFAETKTPVVFLGINNNPRNYFSKDPENIVGILERPLIKRSITYISEIIPNLKNLLVLFDSDLTSQIVETDVFGDQDKINVAGINVEYKSVDTYKEWKDIVTKSKGKYEAVVVGLYQTLKNDKGVVVDPETVVKWTSQNTPIPPFAFWDFAVGKDKTVGGFVLLGEDQGMEAGKMAKKILIGTPLQKISTFIGENGELLFSKKQLKKHKITLPAEIQKRARLIE